MKNQKFPKQGAENKKTSLQDDVPYLPTPLKFRLKQLADDFKCPASQIYPFLIKCLDRYKTTEGALGKLKDILETASRLKISLEESFKLQMEIDSCV
ncbi:hypothetical protein [Xanthovirga aplysinae]|uniref:hypothetical protein n=1 Tax=Xanthovirga aplysinae TaxID=2529853 RepID=UPI0012BD069F|nr:hypothetical protein [Xanthovirga aplysinae]MTI29427.1 hypothetical protein [Xanthovirga aplysinae]